jgi:hypothetical protein
VLEYTPTHIFLLVQISMAYELNLQAITDMLDGPLICERRMISSAFLVPTDLASSLSLQRKLINSAPCPHGNPQGLLGEQCFVSASCGALCLCAGLRVGLRSGINACKIERAFIVHPMLRLVRFDEMGGSVRTDRFSTRKNLASGLFVLRSIARGGGVGRTVMFSSTGPTGPHVRINSVALTRLG